MRDLLKPRVLAAVANLSSPLGLLSVYPLFSVSDIYLLSMPFNVLETLVDDLLVLESQVDRLYSNATRLNPETSERFAS